MDVDFSRPTKLDFILLVAICCVLGGMFFGQFGLTAFGSPGTREAYVHFRNQVIQKVDLARDQAIPVLDQRMVLEVKDGRIRILKSDCPHQTCRHSGWIGKGAGTLVCVPNQIVVEIKNSSPSFIDVVAS